MKNDVITLKKTKGTRLKPGRTDLTIFAVAVSFAAAPRNTSVSGQSSFSFTNCHTIFQKGQICVKIFLYQNDTACFGLPKEWGRPHSCFYKPVSVIIILISTVLSTENRGKGVRGQDYSGDWKKDEERICPGLQ